jgi:hypothetical protein
LAGIVLTLGVVALDAHAALPEHHHQHGTETLCIAALAIAVVALSVLLRPVGRSQPIPRPLTVGLRPRWRGLAPAAAPARAGPASLAVLRR